MPRKPKIAIIGRPNVGKSTLFNRLVGRRQAIVDSTSGVTRDRIDGEFDWENRSYNIYDLAGWDENPENPFSSEIMVTIMRTIETADVLIFLVDGQDGPTSWDSELAKKIRTVSVPIILAVNKCDTVPVFPQADIFWELGLGEPVPISATHNLNIDDLLDRIAHITEDFDAGDEPEDESDRIVVAILGHQNVGKSTLFNALVGDHRAIVSDIPGTTRDAIDTEVELDGVKFLFVDTAGMKKRARIYEAIDFYAIRRTENAISRCSIALILIDCTEGVMDTDSKIAGIVQKKGRAAIIIASKWDESEDAPGHRETFVKHLREKLHFLSYAPVCFTSGLHNRGIKEIFPTVVKVNEQFLRRVPTPVWNRIIEQAVNFRPPPTVRGKRLKLYYITQTQAAPPSLILFVNQPDFLKDQYKRYLEHYIRDQLGFEGAPLDIRVRKRSPGRISSD